MKKLLYVCEADTGGIMEYAIWQSAAIARVGVEVHFLCKPSFPKERLGEGIKVEILKSRNAEPQKSARGLFCKVWRVGNMISDLRAHARQVAELAAILANDSSTRHQLPETCDNLGRPEVSVLIACYKEYFAPFWVGPLRRLAAKEIVIGTIAHDPVRDFVVGPLWWHRWSVGLGYSFVRDVFVHDDTPVDFGGKKPAGIRIHQIPHGPYEVAEPKIGRLEMRRRLGCLTTKDANIHETGKIIDGKIIGTNKEEAGLSLAGRAGATESDSLASELAQSPVSESLIRYADDPASSLTAGHSPLATQASPDVVFLAFGQIRDGKNLDLFLRAMKRLPENVKLIVAGKGDSASSRPVEFYQRLAEELGVGNRCCWDIRRIPDEEVGDFFAACDVVLVTYSAKFRSASGVLNAAVSARKPVLASSGDGPLKSAVEKYQMGVFVEPDNLEEIQRGASMLLRGFAVGKNKIGINPRWEKYERENSWEENARRVVQSMKAVPTESDGENRAN